MAEFVYGLFIVVMVVVLLSSLMLKRTDKKIKQEIRARSALKNILDSLRNNVSGPEYTQQD